MQQIFVKIFKFPRGRVDCAGCGRLISTYSKQGGHSTIRVWFADLSWRERSFGRILRNKTISSKKSLLVIIMARIRTTCLVVLPFTTLLILLPIVMVGSSDHWNINVGSHPSHPHLPLVIIFHKIIWKFTNEIFKK